MKPVKNLLFAVLLVAVLAINTVAGDVQTPGAAAPTPTPPSMTTGGTSTSSLDDPYYVQSQETVETIDSLFYEALAALLSVY